MAATVPESGGADITISPSAGHSLAKFLPPASRLSKYIDLPSNLLSGRAKYIISNREILLFFQLL